MTTAAHAETSRPMRLDIRTTSAAATRALAAWLADVADAGDRIALMGPLGAGKTQFAKGFAEGLGVSEAVTSPSFTLMAEYRGRLPLFHQDLYRLAGAADALDGGLLDERQDAGVTLTEWADRLDAPVDLDRLDVRIVVDEDAATRDDPDAQGDRVLRLAGSPRYARYLERAAAWHPVRP
jgi:tRNA threonylcarbamoyladenosine biosynthesis protein TsaE